MITLIFKGTTRVALSPICVNDGESAVAAARRAVMEAIRAIPGCHDAIIDHDRSGAPFIPGSKLYISVSHSRLTAAVAVDALSPVGIDVEEPRDKQLRRVASRILSDAELAVYDNPQRLLEAWTLKEALYKAVGGTAPDFIRDINLPLSARQAPQAAGRECETVMCRRIAGQQLTVVRVMDGL